MADNDTENFRQDRQSDRQSDRQTDRQTVSHKHKVNNAQSVRVSVSVS